MKMLWPYLKELFYFSRYTFITNIILMVILGLVEGVSVLMVIPLLSVAGIIPSMDMGSGITAWINRFFQHFGLVVNLPVVLVTYLGVTYAQSWLQRYQTQMNVEIQQTFSRFLTLRLFKTIAYAEWQVLMSKTKSEITHILVTELVQLIGATLGLLRLIATILITIIQVILAFIVSPGLTGLVLVGGFVLFVGLRTFTAESQKRGRAILELNSRLFSEVTEHLEGIKEVKSYGIELPQVNKFEEILTKLNSNVIASQVIQNRTSMLYTMGAATFLSIVLVGAVEIFKNSPQDFIIIALISSRLWPKFSSIQMGIQGMNLMLPAFETAKQLEKECLAAQEHLPEDNFQKIELKSGVEFRDVSFCYTSARENYAVNKVNFLLVAGTTNAFVGVSGAGKSTLVDLLIGLLKPVEGSILVDNENLQDNLRPWRSSIGYVPQDSFLLNASIRDNLLWACPNATEEDMWEALQMAAAEEFVRRMANGLETIVGDRGVRLSGGERQRIVLARALLRKPSVLILDEATSSLDMENEKHIQQAIDGLQGKLTIVIVAHRLSTIENADQIFVFEQGKKVEQGTYQLLMDDKNSRFRSLASSHKK